MGVGAGWGTDAGASAGMHRQSVNRQFVDRQFVDRQFVDRQFVDIKQR